MNIEQYRKQTATSWLVRLGADDVSEEDVRSFQQWLAEDERNQNAYIQAEQLWQSVSHLKEPVSLKQRYANNWFVSVAGIAAVCLVVLSVLFNALKERAPENTTLIATTAIGEQKNFALTDGSTLLLNTNSDVQIELTQTVRRVNMTRGEVFFNVAKDKNRPFEIVTPQGEVRVLGTQFSINLQNKNASVIVLEGVVEVSKSSDDVKKLESKRIVLHANQKTVMDSSPKFSVETVDAKSSMTWRKKVLTYQERSIAEIVADLNRYYESEIVLSADSESIQSLQNVSAVLQLRDAASTVEALAESTGLSVAIESGRIELKVAR